jgi:glycosyltransferase involved in cell wall biosynthesis
MVQLSIICPVFNEIQFIDQLYASLKVNDGLNKEIFFVDGGSTDGTVEKLKQFTEGNAQVYYLHNVKRSSTEAFNLAFVHCKAPYIAFVGAHAEYDANYFKHAFDYLEKDECDAVGGPLIQKGKTNIGKAIAAVMSNKWGVGNTSFRTSKTKQYVDSVAFAVYKKTMIDNAGVMDSSLPVNQDDEFHYRLNKLGYRILMVPEMQAVYYVRNTYSALFKQYFKYGLYKPRVLKKIKSAVRLRHLIPALFTIYLLLAIIVFPFFPIAATPAIFYIIFILLVSIRLPLHLSQKLLAVWVFPILHIAYGSGFILGLITKK